ncbi:Homologous-pairing protein 2 [Pleodorina starrii]|uniref:Homologous-pairing protein 2 homolog n=1 Tax=Pleodorina starrii TaxID=330485 RepID=A0A9W6FAJ2_9CHLO
MAAQSAEVQIERIVREQNRPFGLQQLVDLGATTGLKKAQVSKAVDSLVADGKVLCKEFGKTKLFIPPQAGLKVLTKEEFESRKATVKELQQQCQKEAVECKQLESELAQLRSALSEEEIARQTAEVTKKLADDEAKLKMLKAGSVLVTAEERAAVEKTLLTNLDWWRKRRGMFKNIWSAISEGLDGKQADLFEEIGIETDEAAGADMAEVERLMPKKRRM